MIWRWLICFNLAAGTAAPAVLKGKIELRNSREASVKKQADYSGVVVSLQAANNHSTLPAASRHQQLLQKDKAFRPHVLVVEVGTVVDFPNADPIFHNAFSSYSGQIFDVGLYPPATSRAVRFVRPGVVRVFCNIHSFMSAVIVVLDTPYFATTDKKGSFEITAPPGDYELHVYHERATEETLHSLARQVHMRGEIAELPLIVVSESGYLAIPHKNKHGQDYPPAADDRVFYPGVK